ncbi:hypothetical protein CBR_g8375 [Chara braunii]|uniref:Uncharacterized protein n=1 Tax=Chara braunii TaxID=69332 RepID=A0A388KM00_CHABU|nr:hypothetical protein CBR_g8375 [Chara braunii]|eukprot:GBG71076.1 hypothetical protein CBR_g8375 [Chara braunii]
MGAPSVGEGVGGGKEDRMGFHLLVLFDEQVGRQLGRRVSGLKWEKGGGRLRWNNTMKRRRNWVCVG